MLENVATSNIERGHPDQRPPIVLTVMDRERLSALLGDLLKIMDTGDCLFSSRGDRTRGYRAG